MERRKVGGEEEGGRRGGGREGGREAKREGGKRGREWYDKGKERRMEGQLW